jgi:hypothetical protein
VDEIRDVYDLYPGMYVLRLNVRMDFARSMDKHDSKQKLLFLYINYFYLKLK